MTGPRATALIQLALTESRNRAIRLGLYAVEVDTGDGRWGRVSSGTFPTLGAAKNYALLTDRQIRTGLYPEGTTVRVRNTQTGRTWEVR